LKTRVLCFDYAQSRRKRAPMIRTNAREVQATGNNVKSFTRANGGSNARTLGLKTDEF
jgi:hypothetical protein